MRRATRRIYRQWYLQGISIHALLAEGDLVVRELLLIVSSISIHALREEGDIPVKRREIRRSVFLSTPSVRRATPKKYINDKKLENFYPRPPRGGRPLAGSTGADLEAISIHALREEGDLRTACRPVVLVISIHALRGEGDSRSTRASRRLTVFLSTPSVRRATPKKYINDKKLENFYPRPPRGGRHARRR